MVRYVWSNDGMILTGEDSTGRKLCNSATFFHHKFHIITLEWDPNLRNERPVTNGLSLLHSLMHVLADVPCDMLVAAGCVEAFLCLCVRRIMKLMHQKTVSQP